MSAGPLLTTPRLELWRPQQGDLADMFELTRDEETRRFLGPTPPSMPDSFARLLRNAGSWSLWGYGNFMLRMPGSSRIIGGCGVFRSHRGFGADLGLDNVPEAGWVIHRDFTRQGIAREAMEAILAWFDQAHGNQRIAAMIADGHVASDHLAHLLGFAAYGRHQDPETGETLILYERIAGSSAIKACP